MRAGLEALIGLSGLRGLDASLRCVWSASSTNGGVGAARYRVAKRQRPNSVLLRWRTVVASRERR